MMSLVGQEPIRYVGNIWTYFIAYRLGLSQEQAARPRLPTKPELSYCPKLFVHLEMTLCCALDGKRRLMKSARRDA